MSKKPFITDDIIKVALSIFDAYQDTHEEEVGWVIEHAPDKEKAYVAGFLTGVEVAIKAIERGALRPMDIGKG
jgi:hypothetical protein